MRGVQRIRHHRQIRAVTKQPRQLQHRAAAVQINRVARPDERQRRLGNPPLFAGGQRRLVGEHRLVQPALHAHRAAMHAPDGAALFQLIQIPPHGRRRNLQLAAQILDADDAAVADQRPQVVPAPRRQLFLIAVQHGLIELDRI